jgi:hypothetical protein
VLGTGLRWFFVVAAVLAFIAGILLFVLATETDRFFSWTIEPPLTAAFLGAAYWAACVLLAWGARQESWAAVAQTVLPPVFVIAALLLIATVVHLDKFDFDSVFGWFWLVVYVLVVPLLVYYVVEHFRREKLEVGGGPPIPTPLRGALITQAAAMLAVGLALSSFPGRTDGLWPWELTPLTKEVIAAFLLGFGLGALGAWRENDLDRLQGAALAYATLGALELAAFAIHSGDVTASGLGTAVYLGFWAIVLATGAYGLIARSAAARSS